MSTIKPILEDIVTFRRVLFIGITLLITSLATILYLRCYNGLSLIFWDYFSFILFPILFSQIAAGFSFAALGFLDWLKGGDAFNVMRGPWRARGKGDSPRRHRSLCARL